MALATAPARSAIGGLGAALAASAIVLATAFGTNAQANLEDRLRELDATHISVTTNQEGYVTTVFGRRVMRRVADLPGVQAAGLSVSLGTRRFRAHPNQAAAKGGVYAVSNSTLRAVNARFAPHISLGTRRREVAVIGIGLARALSLPPLATAPGIATEAQHVAIASVLSRSPGAPQLIHGIAVSQCCGRLNRSARAAELVIDTEPALTEEIAARLPQLIAPLQPESITVAVDSSPTALRSGIEASMRNVSELIAFAALVLGMMINALLRYAAVRERRAEFGLRAALGARRADITLHMVAECTILAGMGAALGVALGVAGSMVLAHLESHPLGATPESCLEALLAGVASGAVAGLLPAIAAVRISPAAALRS
jgi:ABC-type lipoprotein release transport system permease subunit